MKKMLLILVIIMPVSYLPALMDRATQDEENVLRYTLKNSFGVGTDFEKIFKDALEKYKQKWFTPRTSQLFASYEKAFKHYTQTVIDFINGNANVEQLHVAEDNLDKADKLIKESAGK